LILVKGVFYLCVTVEVPEASPYDPVGVLGVDLGIRIWLLIVMGKFTLVRRS